MISNSELKKYYITFSSKISKLLLEFRYNNNKKAKAKLKSFPCPELTKDDKNKIDVYWQQYGVKFRNYDYFQLYYGSTGEKNPRFIPEPLFALVIMPFYNDAQRRTAYADKNKFYKILPQVNFPKLIGQRINGNYYDHEGKCYGNEITHDFIEKTCSYITDNGQNSIIIKETNDTSTGKGVKKYKIESGTDLEQIILNNESLNYVIQFVVKQHPFFSQFNEDSVNILRVTSWRHGNEVSVFPVCIRFGLPGFSTDVAYVNNKEIVQCAGVKEDGEVKDYFVTLSGEHHPLSITDKHVPCWKEILETVKKNHLSLDYFDIVAWDITVDENSSVICIEYNLRSPGTLVYQFAQGPYAGKYTDELLAFLKDPANQKKYLPKSIRI